MRQNVIASLAVKAVFVVLAPLGLVTLVMAVAADMGMSLLVTLNGLRLLRITDTRPRRRRLPRQPAPTTAARTGNHPAAVLPSAAGAPSATPALRSAAPAVGDRLAANGHAIWLGHTWPAYAVWLWTISVDWPPLPSRPAASPNAVVPQQQTNPPTSSALARTTARSL